MRGYRHGRKHEDQQNRTYWIFGLHAVEAALCNPSRIKHRLVLTRNAAARLTEALNRSGFEYEQADSRRFPAPLDPNSVHQGAALEVSPLEQQTVDSLAERARPGFPLVLLDRVTDPHNVGAIIRTAGAFGLGGVIAPARHSPPETGALAKSASGMLERVPLLRVRNLGSAIDALRNCGVSLIGLDAEAEHSLDEAAQALSHHPVGLVVGAEGAGLRAGTRDRCDMLAAIGLPGGSGSINVSNAAAISIHAFSRRPNQRQSGDG